MNFKTRPRDECVQFILRDTALAESRANRSEYLFERIPNQQCVLDRRADKLFRCLPFLDSAFFNGPALAWSKAKVLEGQ